jgi:hypothetical protein
MTATKLLVHRLIAFAVAIAALWSATDRPRPVRSMNRAWVRRPLWFERWSRFLPCRPFTATDPRSALRPLLEGRKGPEHTRISGNPESTRTQNRLERLMKRRHEFYLEEDVSVRLATMAAEPGSSKTAIMTDALRAYFDQRACTELETVQSSARQAVGPARPHRARPADRGGDAGSPSRFQLMVAAPFSSSDRAARGLAQARFKLFFSNKLPVASPTVAASSRTCFR